MQQAERKHVNQKFLADYIGVSKKTSEGWRLRGIGPEWWKAGGSVRYNLSRVDQWIESRSKAGDLSEAR